MEIINIPKSPLKLYGVEYVKKTIGNDKKMLCKQ